MHGTTRRYERRRCKIRALLLSRSIPTPTAPRTIGLIISGLIKLGRISTAPRDAESTAVAYHGLASLELRRCTEGGLRSNFIASVSWTQGEDVTKMRVNRTPDRKRTASRVPWSSSWSWGPRAGGLGPGDVQLHVRLPVPVPNLQRPSVLVIELDCVKAVQVTKSKLRSLLRWNKMRLRLHSVFGCDVGHHLRRYRRLRKLSKLLVAPGHVAGR
jgi:hypothetical protein